jgi:hypothetical protein
MKKLLILEIMSIVVYFIYIKNKDFAFAIIEVIAICAFIY